MLVVDHPLRLWRKAREITLSRLAREVGVTASHLSEIERWKNDPSFDLITKLSRTTARLDPAGNGVAVEAFFPAEAAE